MADNSTRPPFILHIFLTLPNFLFVSQNYWSPSYTILTLCTSSPWVAPWLPAWIFNTGHLSFFFESPFSRPQDWLTTIARVNICTQPRGLSSSLLRQNRWMVSREVELWLVGGCNIRDFFSENIRNLTLRDAYSRHLDSHLDLVTYFRFFRELFSIRTNTSMSCPAIR